MSQSYRDRAVVLRSYDFGEADRVIVLLTRSHGVVRGVAKGVRRARSRFGARLQPFVDVDVLLYPGRTLARIASVDTVAFFGAGIIADYERYTSASAVTEVAERLAVPVTGDSELFDLVVRTLSRLQDAVSPTSVLDAFLLQAMEHSGWAPSLFECSQCGESGPHRSFHPAVGGAVCARCRPPGARDVPEEALHVMWLLLRDRWDGEVEHRHVVHVLTVEYLQFHLERRIASLGVL